MQNIKAVSSYDDGSLFDNNQFARFPYLRKHKAAPMAVLNSAC